MPTFVFPYSPPPVFVSAVKSDVFPLPAGPTMPTSRAMGRKVASPPMGANRVRRLRADEWRELKEIRLAALDDAPDAFATRHAEASERDDARWRADALRGSGAQSPTSSPWTEGVSSAWSAAGATAASHG